MIDTWFKCEDCGELCTEDELEYQTEYISSEFWGFPCTEEYTTRICPHCGSEYINETFIDEEEE